VEQLEFTSSESVPDPKRETTHYGWRRCYQQPPIILAPTLQDCERIIRSLNLHKTLSLQRGLDGPRRIYKPLLPEARFVAGVKHCSWIPACAGMTSSKLELSTRITNTFIASSRGNAYPDQPGKQTVPLETHPKTASAAGYKIIRISECFSSAGPAARCRSGFPSARINPLLRPVP